MELIAGDIGGTKSWLAWVRGSANGEHAVRYEHIYASADFDSAEALLRRFIADTDTDAHPDRLNLALPGPVADQRAKLTNLDWALDAAELGRALDVADVHFINDFQAAAEGVVTLTDEDMVALNSVPAQPGGVRAITGAGTGLGLAFMVADADGRYHSHASEGGHVDFAPADARQARLLEGLRDDHGHVSWERVVSGSAMDALYRFCCAEHGVPLPDEAIEGAEVTACAEAGEAVAEATLDLFISLYGAWVGNVVLMYHPGGGLYIAGGVAGHLQDRMRSPRFIESAVDKGRMRGVVERTPIYLITCNRLGLQGAIAHGLARH